MTTIAFSGDFMAADSKQTDTWGLISCCSDKIAAYPHVLIGGAGEAAQLRKWRRDLKFDWRFEDFRDFGYPTYKKDEDDPSILLVDRKSRAIWAHSQGIFLPQERPFHAIGSGRDFALAAMACGKSAYDAVQIAIQFDNGSGGVIQVVQA